MARLVRQPGRARQVADGIEARHAGAAEAIDGDVRLVDLHAERFEAKILHIADNADGEDGAVELLRFLLAVFRRDVGSDDILARLDVFDLRARQNIQALFFKILLGEGGNLRVLHRQDAVHDFDDRNLGAKLIIEARKLNSDGAGADHQQAFGHHVRRHRLPVGPDELAIRDEACLRNIARAGAGGEHHVFGRVRRILAILAPDDDLRCGRALLETRTTFDHVDLVLLHEELHAVRQLGRDAA